METITFYSNKSNDNRSELLINMAALLSLFGQETGVMDFDLKSAAAHHKLQAFLSQPINMGLMDYIYQSRIDNALPPTLADYYLKTNDLPQYRGNISFFPAGSRDSSLYRQKWTAINWKELLQKEGALGIPIYLQLKEKLREELSLDFLLIEASTHSDDINYLFTALMSDRVVYLLDNEKESIESTRKILRDLQLFYRLKRRKSMPVELVLTSIHRPGTVQEEENQQNKIDDIHKYFNEETTNPDEQLNIMGISILSSSKDLQLSPQSGLDQINLKKFSLDDDPFRLFLKIIPQKPICSKIDQVSGTIVTRRRIFEEPDNVHKEIEALPVIYPHARSFENLILYYLMKKVAGVEILPVFGKLWNLSKHLNRKLVSNFKKIFLTASWEDLKDIHFDIAEYCLLHNVGNYFAFKFKLSQMYYLNKKYDNALKHLLELVRNQKERSKPENIQLLKTIFEIALETKKYDEAFSSYQLLYKFITGPGYSQLIIQAVKILERMNKHEEIKRLLAIDDQLEEMLFKKQPVLFFSVLTILGRKEEVDLKLNAMTDKASKLRDFDFWFELGKIYYLLGRKEAFDKMVSDRFSFPNRLLDELKRF
jgi:hypothetical protein